MFSFNVVQISTILCCINPQRIHNSSTSVQRRMHSLLVSGEVLEQCTSSVMTYLK